MAQSLFGTAGRRGPGRGTRARTRASSAHDDLVPVIGGFGFLCEDDKTAIFNRNPAKVFPRLVEV